MADKKEEKKEEKKVEETKKYQQTKRYLVKNRHNFPNETFKIKGIQYRFEPRGFTGDSHVLDETIVSHPNFKTHHKYFEIKEVK